MVDTIKVVSEEQFKWKDMFFDTKTYIKLANDFIHL